MTVFSKYKIVSFISSFLDNQTISRLPNADIIARLIIFTSVTLDLIKYRELLIQYLLRIQSRLFLVIWIVLSIQII